MLEVELNVAGENALMLPRDGVALPNGNFHAGVLTLALDSLRGAMAQSASLVAARVSALLDPDVTGLTPQLAHEPGARLRRDDPRVHGARGRRRGALAGGDGGVADHDRAVGDRVARELRGALGAADLGRAGADGGCGIGGAGAGGAGAAAARARAGRRGRGAAFYDAAAARLDPDMDDRPLSSDLEAARQLLFDDALWMDAERE